MSSKNPNKDPDAPQEKSPANPEKKANGNGAKKTGGLTVDVSLPAGERKPPPKH